MMPVLYIAKLSKTLVLNFARCFTLKCQHADSSNVWGLQGQLWLLTYRANE